MNRSATNVIKKKLSNHFRNQSNIQQAKSFEPSSPLHNSQRFSDIAYHIDEVKQKCKSSFIDFHKNYLKSSHFTEEIFSQLEEIDKASTIAKTFEHLFNILKLIYNKQKIEEYQKRGQQNFKGIIIKIKSDQATKLRLFRDDNPHHKTKSKKIQQLENNLQETKREFYNLKQQKVSLQKKFIAVIQEYQIRKKFYLAEIKKLTNIVKLSTEDIRALVLEKTYQKRQLQKIDQNKKHSIMPHFQTSNMQQGPKSPEKMIAFIPSESSLPPNSSSRINPQQGLYNVELKMLNKLGSIQQMQQTRNDIYME